MQKYRSSKRGLTFSIDPEEKYYPGSHYIYEVRKNCIIIRPSDNGMTVRTFAGAPRRLRENPEVFRR